ncbi:MAG: CsbD family protein [Beijerinckiaceae bacterium]|nr:CsbD family protein [Beijerinckiaceae bacterium]
MTDKKRVEGSLDQAKGKAKEVAGSATGDAKLKNDGKSDTAKGKIENAVGGAKDALKGE